MSRRHPLDVINRFSDQPVLISRLLSLALLGTVVLISPGMAQQPADIRHVVAAIEKDRFHGWPANNGAWQWGDELLVGFTQGDYDSVDGHNIKGIEESKFARSRDGGESWEMFDPDNFLDDENVKWLPQGKKKLTSPIDFKHGGFAMRVFGTGYHGNDDPAGGFYYSYDRGATWNGPYYLGDINSHEALRDKALTPRTDYLVLGKRECIVFITARDNGNNDANNRGSQRIACIRTVDGGVSFELLSWITPASDEYRTIMPCTIQLSANEFVTAFRKINVDKSQLESTIDTYHSADQGRSWSFLSTIKEIKFNSNPPALLKLADGRLCCVYGDRDVGKIAGKMSNDSGKSWGQEFTIRADYVDSDDWADMGYPRLAQRSDGKLVAMYYWASPEHPQHYIAASIWQP